MIGGTSVKYQSVYAVDAVFKQLLFDKFTKIGKKWSCSMKMKQKSRKKRREEER